MNGQEMELALVLFFLVALVLISRFREQFIEEDRQGYQHIFASVSILSMTALLKLAAASSIFTNVVFLSDSGSIQLLVLIGSLTGIVLLTAGISSWLPIARVQRQIGQERVDKLEVVRKVAQLVKIESRLPELLQNSMRYIAEGCRFERGELYCCLPYEKSIRFLEAFTGPMSPEAPEGAIQFSRTVFSQRNRHETFDYEELIDSYPANMPKATIVQPILSCGRLVALMLFWVPDQERANPEVRSIVNTVANLLGRQVRSAALEIQVDLFARSNEITGNLTSMQTKEESYRSFVSQLVSQFRPSLSFDQMSLTRLSPTGDVRRYSIGHNGAFLEELNLDKAAEVSATAYLAAHDGIMFSGMRDSREIDQIGQVYSMTRMNSQLVGLIRGIENETAIIRFGCTKGGFYRPRHKYLLQAILPIMNEKLRLLSEREVSKSYTDRVRSIKQLVEHLSTDMRFEDIACKAAESVLAATGSDMVRVSLADKRMTFLSSCAMRLSRSIEPQTPTQGHMILALMPNHLRAITDKQSIVHDQIDFADQQEDAEWSQVLAPSIGSALITPFGTHTRKGVITIGGSKGWVANTETCQFVQLVSNLLSLSLASTERIEKQVDIISEETSSVAATNSSLYRQSQIRSAMTGLMGSIELLESDRTTENNLDNCLHIMRNSVSKLISLTSDPVSETTPINVTSNRTGLPTGILESI